MNKNNHRQLKMETGLQHSKNFIPSYNGFDFDIDCN